MDLTGIFAPLTTPFGSSGELRTGQLASNVAQYNRTGLAGYLVLGSSAEAIYLSTEEKLEVLGTVAEGAGPGKILLAGTGEESLRGTLAMTREAARLGYHAAVVRTPHYYKAAMTQAAFLQFYRQVAEDSPIPVLPYNIPPLTGVDLGVEATLELAGHANIVGLKESSGNMDKIVRILAGLDGVTFSVLVGGPSTLYPSLCAGAQGAILALASAAPEACLAIASAFREGDHAGALAAQREVLPASVTLAQFGIAGLKYAAELGGYACGPPRLPQLPLTADQRQQVEKAFRPLLVIA